MQEKFEVQVEIFQGIDSPEKFNKWSSLHPEAQIQQLKTESITQGMLDGTVTLTVTYTQPRKIIAVIGGEY